MHFPVFKTSDLMPFVHWALIMASYFISKLFIKEAFVKNQKYLSLTEKIFYSIYVLVPAIAAACIISLFISDDWINWAAYISVITPSLLGCFLGVNTTNETGIVNDLNDSGGRY